MDEDIHRTDDCELAEDGMHLSPTYTDQMETKDENAKAIHVHQIHHHHVTVGGDMYMNSRLIKGDYRSAEIGVLNNDSLHIASSSNQAGFSENNPRPSTTETEELNIVRILKTLHKDTWEKTHVSVRDAFRRDKFDEPHFIVHPQMSQSDHYYRGGHLTATTMQYKKETKFTFRESKEQSSLSTEVLIEKIHEKKDKLGVIGLIAQAGAGKTTCMRRWARSTMEMNGIRKENDFKNVAGSRFELVIFINLKRFHNSDKKLYFREILFGELFPNEKDPETAYAWILDNQDKVAIFMDGLDQAPWTVTQSNAFEVGPHGRETTPTLMFNLLARNILPGARVIISSREFAVTSLPEVAWTDDVVTLTGFSDNDARRLFNYFTADTESTSTSTANKTAETTQKDITTGVSNWDQLAKDSPALLPLLAIPAFLMFAAIVFKKSGRAPVTATDLMIKVIESLPDSLIVRIRESKNIWQIVNKLKILAHEGMEKGIVIFSERDLNNCGLQIEDVRDLLLAVPKSRTISNKLLEGDKMLIFCHQSLQEFLSACAIVEMDLEKFKSFFRMNFKSDRWSVVRRFVCGLAWSQQRDVNFMDISDVEKKQEYIRGVIRSELKVGKKYHILEVYANIYEANDDQLTQSLSKEFTLEYTPLARDSCHMISSLLARCRKLDFVSIEACKVTDELLNLMARNFYTVSVHMKYICIDNVFGSSPLTFTALNNFLRNVDSDEIALEHNQLVTKPEGPDWNSIRRLKILLRKKAAGNRFSYLTDPKYILTSTPKSIYLEIEENGISRKFDGAFERSDESLNLNVDLSESCVTVKRKADALDVALCYLHPKTVSVNAAGVSAQQYFKPKQMNLTESWQVSGKVKEVVIDCYIHEHVSDSEKAPLREGVKIRSFAERFQVEIMNVMIRLGDLQTIPEELEKDLSATGCKLRIWIYEIIGSDEALVRLHGLIRENQINYAWVVISYKATLEELTKFVSECNVKKRLILGLSDKLSDDDMGKLQIATKSSELVIKSDGPECSRENLDDAWSWIGGF